MVPTSSGDVVVTTTFVSHWMFLKLINGACFAGTKPVLTVTNNPRRCPLFKKTIRSNFKKIEVNGTGVGPTSTSLKR